MTTFFLFGKYSAESLKGAGPDRTRRAQELVRKAGGSVGAIYGLMGPYDLVMICQFPDAEEALKASVALTKITGISFSTMPAIPVEHFDKLISDN